jgi:hypothetical protein
VPECHRECAQRPSKLLEKHLFHRLVRSAMPGLASRMLITILDTMRVVLMAACTVTMLAVSAMAPPGLCKPIFDSCRVQVTAKRHPKISRPDLLMHHYISTHL